jgi:membrane fusion protein (multidrug efflux system)
MPFHGQPIDVTKDIIGSPMHRLKIFFLLVAITLPVFAQAPKSPKKPTPVIVAEVELIPFFDKVESLGTLNANESVDLASSVTELVTAVLFKDNQRVKKGTVLVKMNIAEEQAVLAEQQSFLQESQLQINRISPLVKKGAASAAILDENRREAAVFKARIAAIESRIDQRVIKAPFDGVLGLRNISVGALAQPGSLITTIDDDLIMKLDFSVPEVFISTLKPGIIIEATTQAYPDILFKGEINSVNSRIDPVTRSIQVRALIDNKDGLLKPGLLMQVDLQKNPRKALVIPEEAVIVNGPYNFVLVITTIDGQTNSVRRKVEIGARKFGVVEILSGLNAGDQVLTHGALRVRPGTPLSITAVERNNETLKVLLKDSVLENKVTSDKKLSDKTLDTPKQVN